VEVGTTLDGRFALLARAEYDLPGVERFLAHDIRLGSDVVVDEISSVAPRAVRRAALSTLVVRDPRLPRTIAASAADTSTYIVTERAEGISLATILGKRRLDEDRARAVVGEVARALAEASAGGVHHGWLRPESVFVDDRGRVSITGLAVDGELALQAGWRRGRGEGADATALARIFLASVTGRPAITATDADLPDLTPASRSLCEDALAGKPVASLTHILDAVGPFDARSLR
jgi:serine/threonine protein kinase